MMKCINTLLSVLLCVSLLNSQDQDYYPPSPVPDRIMLNLTESPATSMAVTWRTAVYVNKGYVQYTKASPSPDLLENAQVATAKKTPYLSDRNGANYFSAVLGELEPETLYAYRVGDSTSHWSEWAQFKTAAAGEAPLSFIYFGDAQNNLKSMWSRTIRGAYQEMPKANFMLHAGDLVNRRNRDHEWGEWYYAGGWIYRMMPSIATPGNHEYGRNEEGYYSLSKHWKPTFTLPENGPEGFAETVYYIDYQDTRLISFDAPAFYRSPKDSSIQVDWLREVLKNNDNKWTILTTHYPIYSTKNGRDNDELRNGIQSLLEEYKVDLVLTGHDHAYGRGTNLPIGKGKRATVDGPIYVVSVSGPKMYDVGMDDWMQRGAANTQLYQLVHVDGDLLRFEAYTVDNKLYDAFELKKNKKGRNLFFDLAPENVPERLELPPRYKNSFTAEELADYKARFEAYQKRKKK